jgi:RNA polymerase sigma factor (sigma-70 family)
MARERSGGDLSGQLGMLFSLGTVGEWSDGQLLGRFLAREAPAESEAAFAALVERHGAMVLGVCRRILGDSHDAQDAFQATFLLLVRKANTIRSRESVEDWLFRIARRVAVRAGVDAVRRRQHLEALTSERRNSLGGEAAIPRDAEPDYGALIAEVDRLPERFRVPIVLHYFEGLSTDAIAGRLGCARGTVLSRLSRARVRLRSRLERRGLSLDAVWPIGAVANRLAWRETVPSLLVQNTIRAGASLVLAGEAIESVVPATVAALAHAVGRTLVFSRFRTAACLFILAAAGVSFGLAASLDPEDEPSRPAQAPGMASPARGASAKGEAAPPNGPAREDSLVFRGQVLDPDGKPVAGASIVLSSHDVLRPPRRLATSGTDGRFEAAIQSASVVVGQAVHEAPGADDIQALGADGDAVTHLAALAPGFGPAWVKIDRRAAEEPVVIRLRRDELPIEGRILSLEGLPVADARVSVFGIGDLPDRFLATLRTDAGQSDPNPLWTDVMDRRLILAKTGPLADARTGPDGRFCMNGLGRDRIVLLIIEGESIIQSDATVLTTDDPTYKPLSLSLDETPEFKLHGPKFELTLAPGRVIEGTVRDRDTGRPIPGAKFGSSWSWAMGESTVDGQGRFRLAGMPKAPRNYLKAAADDQPYVKVFKPVGDPQGLGPVKADIELKRGVWVTGRVIDRTSGRPVRAIVQYLTFRDNPHVRDYPEAALFRGITGSGEVAYRTDADGRFRAVALPGGGLLAVRSLEPGYLTAEPLTPNAAGNVLDQSSFAYQQSNFQALVPINLRENEDSAISDITLTPGRPQHVRPVGPDGRTVERTLTFGEHSRSWLGDLVPGAEFTFIHPRPGKPETVVIFSENREMAAFVDIKGGEPDPIRVALQPSGAVAGRLVDEEGRPRPNVRLEVQYTISTGGDTESEEQRFAPPPMTGPDGRFRIRGLVPGMSYTLAVIKRGEKNYEFRYEGYLHTNRWTLKPGEVSDWGDVRPTEY